MRDYISEIKKINTDGFITEFSKISIDMFNHDKFYENIRVQRKYYGLVQTGNIGLSAWDIHNMQYLSVVHSNDYRRGKKVASILELINLYRKYDNEHSVADEIKNTRSLNGLFRIILGMTAEQFLFENMSWVFEKFNRDYFILCAANHFKNRGKINVDMVVNSVLGVSVEEYFELLIFLWWLCTQNPEPLSAPADRFPRNCNTVLTKENLTKIVDYYSCDYDGLRSSPVKQQLLYSKPFVKTDRYGKYLSSSAYLITMLVGNGLYWLIRDYYCKKGNQVFVNAFGLLFEDYVVDLAERYCHPNEWSQLPTGKHKEADFIFDFGEVEMIVEAKTSLLKIDAKQQVPNQSSTDTFFTNTIEKSYKQLQSTYQRKSQGTMKPLIKVILLYDEFSNTSIIEGSIDTIFHNDPNCFVITIREFEILLYLHRNDKKMEMVVFQEVLIQIKRGGNRKSIGAILEECDLLRNPHLDESVDYFSKLMERLGDQYK